MSDNILGIDPGARESGVIVRRRDDLIYAEVSLDLLETLSALPLRLSELEMWDVLAIEDVNVPNPHMGMTNVGGLIGTAKLIGAVCALHPEAIVVPPGGNGSGPLSAYPEALRPTSGKGAGKDRLRHCRSAWDVSLAAERMMRVGAA